MYLSIIMRSMLMSAVCLIAACSSGDSGAGKSTDTSASATATDTITDEQGLAVSPTGGNFTVMLPPGYPEGKQSTQSVPTAIGPVEMITYISPSSDESQIAMIAWADYPSELIKGDVTMLLDSTRNGALRNLNGTVISEKEITLNGAPGRSVNFYGSSQGTNVYGRFDYYIVAPRLYQVGYLGKDSASIYDPGVALFFKSFKLTEAPPAATGDSANDTTN